MYKIAIYMYNYTVFANSIDKVYLCVYYNYHNICKKLTLRKDWFQ